MPVQNIKSYYILIKGELKNHPLFQAFDLVLGKEQNAE